MYVAKNSQCICTCQYYCVCLCTRFVYNLLISNVYYCSFSYAGKIKLFVCVITAFRYYLRIRNNLTRKIGNTLWFLCLFFFFFIVKLKMTSSSVKRRVVHTSIYCRHPKAFDSHDFSYYL